MPPYTSNYESSIASDLVGSMRVGKAQNSQKHGSGTLFVENSLEFLDFSNKKQTLSPIRLMMLNNEGYSVSSIIFNRPILTSQTGIKLSYSSVTPQFNTFDIKFKYYDFDLKVDFS